MSLRGLVTTLGLAALLAPASLAAQVALDSAGLEPVLVELAVGRYGSRTVPAYRTGGDALLPLLQLAEMAELRARPLANRAVELTLGTGREGEPRSETGGRRAGQLTAGLWGFSAREK